MEFSAPIYVLKRKAKLLAREASMPLHQALDRIAREEGFRAWSHLAASLRRESPADEILRRVHPGELCLIGARPGQGKTLLGLELAAKAAQVQRKGYFFTLDYHEQDVEERLASLGYNMRSNENAVIVDTSDDVSADHIMRRLKAESTPALIVVDYLQLLDQKRTHPSLDDQMRALRSFVRDRDAICVIISQIDRRFDLKDVPMPGLSDIRLPNPLDLSVFSKFFFLHEGEIRLDLAA